MQTMNEIQIEQYPCTSLTRTYKTPKQIYIKEICHIKESTYNNKNRQSPEKLITIGKILQLFQINYKSDSQH